MSLNFLRKKIKYVAYGDNEMNERGEALEDQKNPQADLSNTDYSDSQVVYYSDEDLKDSAYRKMARLVLMIGVFLVPLFFLPWTTSILELNKQMLLVAVAGLSLVLLLLDVVMSGKLSWRSNSLDKGVLGLLVVVLLSTIFSAVKFKSIFGLGNSLSDSLLTVVVLTVVYFLLVNSFDDMGKSLKNLFVISLTAVLIYGLLQLFGVYIFEYVNISIFNLTESRAFNTLGSVNVLGIMAAIGLPLLYSSKILVFRYFNIAKLGLLVGLALLVITNWWMLWVVAIAGMVSTVVLESVKFRLPSDRESSITKQPEQESSVTDYKSGKRLKTLKFFFPAFVIILGIFLVVVNFNFIFVKSQLPVEVAPSFKLSGHIVQKVWEEKLILGYGPENFSLAFDKYGAAALSNSTLSNLKFFDATSQVLNFVVHNGIAGLAALVFLFWLFGHLLVKKIRVKVVEFVEPARGERAESIEWADPEIVGVVSALVASIVAIFLYPFNMVLAFTFYVLLALFILAVRGGQRTVYNVEETTSLSLVSSLGFIGGLIVSLVGFYFVGFNYVAELRYAEALVQTQPQKAIDSIAQAIKWKENDDRFYRFASQAQLALLSNELAGSPTKSDSQRNSRLQNYVATSVALARRAVEIAPQESNNWFNLGTIYQNLLTLVDGSDALAEAAYVKASELRPGDPSFHNRIGGMYLAKADLLARLAAGGGSATPGFRQQAGVSLVKAEGNFKKAIGFSNNFGLAIYNLGAVYDRQGKITEAIKQLEKLAPFNSNQPGLAFELGLLYYRANQKDKAFDQLQKAVVLFPEYANARWYLALIYEERKEIKQAMVQLASILAIEVNKNNQIVKDKLSELQAGNISIPPGNVLDQKPL